MPPEKTTLLPEAEKFIQNHINGTYEDAMVYTRALRASTIAGKVRSEDDIVSRKTNCLGVNTQLGEYLDPRLNHSLGLVMRFGWQPDTDLSGIHIVSLIKDPETTQKHFVDPMPAAGYMYGTSGRLDERPDGTLSYWDSDMQSTSLIKQLSSDEVAAVGLHYFAKGRMSVDYDEAKRLARDAAEGLSEVPGYYARNFLLLDQLEGDESYSLFNEHAPIEGVRSSQARDINDTLKREVLNGRQEEMRGNIRRHIARAAGFLAIENDPYVQNYWGGVTQELSLGFTAMNAIPHASLSHQDFHSATPIKAYEEHMTSRHVGYCRSDLYRA